MLLTSLPPEIITYIFLKLPIKTLLTLKSVNKLCLEIVSSPDFIKERLKISSEDVNFSSYRVIVPDGSSQWSSRSLMQLPFQSLLSNYLTNLVNLDYPDNDLLSHLASLVGSCNGLLCIVLKYRYMVLWNPCIGKYKKIPSPDPKIISPLNIAYGFGYDESNDDYKIVCVYDWFKNGTWHQFMVKVYSLTRNSWKRLEDYKGDVLNSNPAITASGKFHWFSYPQGMIDHEKGLVSFDIENEVFGIVEQPNYGSGPFNSTLGVLGGCLCVMCYDRINKYTDLWVMKEHGVKESWTKMVTVDMREDMNKTWWLRPCSMLPNGEILLDNSDSFLIYNPKDDSIKSTLISEWDYLYEPVIYVESLVSPLVYGRQLRRRTYNKKR